MRSILALLLALLTLHTSPAYAADPSDVAQVVRLMPEQCWSAILISFYSNQYMVYKEGKGLTVVSRAVYTPLAPIEVYICVDTDGDGQVNYGLYYPNVRLSKEGVMAPSQSFNSNSWRPEELHVQTACQGTYDTGVYKALHPTPLPRQARAARQKPK